MFAILKIKLIIPKIFILAYFNTLDSKAKCSEIAV